MRIKFNEISTSSTRYEITDTSWFPVEVLKRCSPVVANVILTKKNSDKVEIRGDLQTSVELVCDRCVGKYVFQIDIQMHLIIQYPDDNCWELHDLQCTNVDLDTITIQEPLVDLGDILRQQVFLALPEKSLCDHSCLGLCSSCGANLNQSSCLCDKTTKESPFSVLATLKRK